MTLITLNALHRSYYNAKMDLVNSAGLS